MLFPSWLRSLRSLTQGAPARWTNRRERRRGRRSQLLFFELLEERTVLSPYVVFTTADSGPGSLRDAINQVNADTSHTL